MGWLVGIAVLAGCAFDPPQQATSTDAAPVPDSTPGPDAAPVTCPARYDEHFGGHSYFATGGMSRSAAQSTCAQDGGHLIKIETDDEALELADRVDIFFPPTAVWIGLADHGTGTYVWEDGSAPGFARWNGSAPNTGDPDCVIENTTDGNGRWQASECNANLLGICECDAN